LGRFFPFLLLSGVSLMNEFEEENMKCMKEIRLKIFAGLAFLFLLSLSLS
jgi:hypothetical protein